MTSGTSSSGRELAALVARARARQRPVPKHEAVRTELALTPVQHAMWLHGQRHDDLSAAVMRWVARLDGDLDVARLAEAFRAAMRRHPALRSVIRETTQGPRRLVLEEVPAVAVLEASASDPDVAEQEAVRLIAQHDAGVTPGGPVAAVTIVRTAPRTTVLGLTVHHLFFDGRSLRLVLDDVARWCDAAPGDRESVPLAEPMRAPQTGPRDGEDRAFWSSTLADAPAPARLVARPSSGAMSYERALPADVSATLRNVAARVGVTMFVVLAAAQALASRRLGAGDDLVFVTPADVRTFEQQDEAGYFVNTMPVRVTIGDTSATGSDLLRRIGDDVARSLDARRLPVHEIVELWRRESGHELLEPFTTMIDVVPGGAHNLVIAGLEVRSLSPAAEAHVDFPLEVSLVDERCVRLVVAHRAGVLGQEGAGVVLDALEDALGVLAERPDAPLDWCEPGRTPVVFIAASPGKDEGEGSGGGKLTIGTCREETLREVLQAFAAALQLDDLPSPDAGFFDLGGHSLGAMRLGIEVRQRLGARITVRDVFENPTARSLAVVAEARVPA